MQTDIHAPLVIYLIIFGTIRQEVDSSLFYSAQSCFALYPASAAAFLAVLVAKKAVSINFILLPSNYITIQAMQVHGFPP